MLTYEQLIAALIEHLEQHQINIVHTQELLDTHTLGRSLHVTCLPPNVDKSGAWSQPPLRAVVGVHWPAELTVASIHGQPIIDALNQIVAERLPTLRHASPMAFDVTYFLPLSDDEQQAADFDHLGAKLHHLFAGQAEVEAHTEINGVLRARIDQPPVLAQLTVTRIFPIEQLRAEAVAEAIAALSSELHEMLPRLATVFQPAPSNPQPALDPQFYLRPPTA
ncbi:hypothetical protein [Chloroflexus sp.]|uniref:hypothetical protein n=1 Tax=Chloroflexus sp. TaxID=1904827 RepID=UPI00298EE5AE|nr:hypothetical protein [Chloroflexus sp.]MDW8402622.1 hypothetical protein [Chloroflexus sp.]